MALGLVVIISDESRHRSDDTFVTADHIADYDPALSDLVGA
jgi:hypothetical protein